MVDNARRASILILAIALSSLSLGGCDKETDKDRIAREYGTTPEAIDEVMATARAEADRQRLPHASRKPVDDSRVAK